MAPFRLLLHINALSMGRKVLMLREKSRLWVGVIGLFLVGYAVMAYGLFFQGLRFLSRFPGLGGLLVERLLFLLFACLFGLLLLSNLVISYSNFFRNRESEFLLPLPIPRRPSSDGNSSSRSSWPRGPSCFSSLRC